MILSFPLELKAMGEHGTFRGLASTYNNPDLVDDIIEPGAFTRTLSANKQLPLLFEHRTAIGTVDLQDSPQGLIAEGKLTLAVQAARDAYELAKSGAVTGLSIGFQAIREKMDGMVRRISEARLFEVSLTAIPCNPSARLLSVKSATCAQQINRAAEELRQFYLSIRSNHA